ncbi:MAG: hypothetical protein ACXW3Q_13100 [Rhodoplanes sp.]
MKRSYVKAGDQWVRRER